MRPQQLRRLLDRGQYLLVGLAVGVVPLVFYIGNQNIVLLKPLLAEGIVLVAFALWMAEAIEKGRFRLTPTPLNGLLVTYFLWTLATVLTAGRFWYFGLEEAGRYLAVFLLFLLAVKVLRSRRRLRGLLWVVYAVGLLATVYGWLQYQDLGFINWGQTVLISTFGNKNFFAGFLVLSIPLVFGGVVAFSRTPVRIMLGALGAFQIYMLLVTGTRTGFIGLLVGGGLFAVLFLGYHWRRRSAKRRRRDLLLAAGMLILFGVIVYTVVPSHLFRRLGEAFDLQQGTGRVRWIMWTGSSRAAGDAVWTGHGHGSFQLVFPYHRPTFYHRFRVSHNTRHSHNEYLEILMETGAVGLALYLLMFVVTGFVVYRFLRRTRGRFYPYLVIGAAASVGGALAQNMASVNMRWMSSTLTFWFVMALLFASVRLGCGEDSPDPGGDAPDLGRGSVGSGWRPAAHALVALALIGAGYGLYREYQADVWLNRLNGYISLASRRAGYWRLAARAGETALDYNPYSLSTRYKLGYVYLNQGRYGAAGRVYGNLTALAPNYAQIHNNIALIHRRRKRPNRALLHFEWATMLEDNFRNHLNLVREWDQRGRRDRALYHALFVPRIHLEEVRDHVHVQSVRLADRNFEGAWNRARQRRNLAPRLERGWSYLQRSISRRGPDFRNRYGLRLVLTGADPSRTMRAVSALDGTRPGAGPLLLGAVGRWRGVGEKTVGSLRRRLERRLKESPAAERPLVRLARAELYAQQGRFREALGLLERIRGSLPDHPRARDSVRYVRRAARRGGAPGGTQLD